MSDLQNKEKPLGAQGATEGVSAGSIDSAAASHAAGPWRILDRDGICYHVISADATFQTGCIAFDARGFANAHLIAAAPEMLEALKALMAQFDAGYFVRNIENDGQPDWAIKAARSVRTLATAVQAIAKAEGKP